MKIDVFCRQLKQKTGLDVCAPINTKDKTKRYETELPSGMLGVYIERKGISHTVLLDKEIFKQSPASDTGYYMGLVMRQWYQHIKRMAAEILWQESKLS